LRYLEVEEERRKEMKEREERMVQRQIDLKY